MEITYVELIIHILVLIGVWINTSINIVHRINKK